MFHRLSDANNSPALAKAKYIELAHVESAKRLKEGTLDAVFIVDSFSAPVVQSLMQDPDIHIMSFSLADAYVKKFPFLEKLVIPRGSFNLEKYCLQKTLFC